MQLLHFTGSKLFRGKATRLPTCHLQVPTSKFLCTLSVLCSHHQVSLLLKGTLEALFYLLYSVFQQIASRMSFTFLKDPHPVN